MNIQKGSWIPLIHMILLITGCQTRQTLLEKKSISIINVGGFLFKDHNKNGKVDIYEDWRVSSDERALDLLNHMTLEEKAGMVLVSTARMKNELPSGEPPENEHPSSDFSEKDLFIDINKYTGKKLHHRIMQIAGTTKAINDLHLRHFILNTKASPEIIAEWSNKVQELCEKSRLGIPALVSSDPRNLLTGNFGTDSAFSKWPSELGLAAMRDSKMVRIFAEIVRQEWLSCGLRKCNMYFADLGTEPRWQSYSRTSGEDSGLSAEIVREIVRGFQGSFLSDTSVSVDIRNFPGGGAVTKGYDPHYDYGKSQVFPGGMFKNNLIPFRAAITAGASSITTYYSLPSGTEYSEVAYAYNREILQGMLREISGFKGIINASSESVFMIPWGMEKLTIEERYSKILEAGINSFEGMADPDFLIRTLKAGKADMKYLDESVHLLLKEIFELGLFENPYVDEEKAEVIVTSRNDFQKMADIALRKSIVLLRNDNDILPLKDKTRIYFEIHGKDQESELNGRSLVYNDTAYYKNYFIVTKPEDADITLLWLKPSVRPAFPEDSSEIRLSLSACSVDTGYVNSLAKIKPVIIAINYSNPFVIDEVYNEHTRAHYPGVLATFGTTPDALLDIITGKFNPSGKMPFSTPVSEDAVRSNREDVPGYLEGESYALFRFDEGLSYREK